MSLVSAALEAGVMVVNIDDHFGWEWMRLYRPENKIAYLLSQFSSNEIEGLGTGVDLAPRLKERSDAAELILTAVEATTGIKVDLQVNTDFVGVDHESAGLGSDLLNDREKLLDFIFSPDAYVQLGNDNNQAPARIETDLGQRVDMYPEHFIEKPFKGLKVEIEAQSYGKQATVFINRDKESHLLEERFCAARHLRGMLRNFAIGDVDVTLFKPKHFNSLSVIEGRMSDGSKLWGNHAQIAITAQNAIHGLIKILSGEPGDIRIPKDINVTIRIENTEGDRYSTPEPKIRFTGVLHPRDLEHLTTSLTNYKNDKLEIDEGMSP